MNANSHGDPQAQQHGTSKRRTGAAAIVTAVVGGLVLLGLGTTAAVAAVGVAADRGGSGTGGSTIEATGLTSISADIGAASLTVEYAQTSEIMLDTAGARAGDWTLRRTGDELIVKSPRTSFGGGCIFGTCVPVGGQHSRATLILPQSMETKGLDASFEIGAGELTATGHFGELDVEVGVGSATLSGSADEFEASIDVGDLTGTLSDVREADVSVAIGDATVTLTGAAPREVTLQVDLGSLELNVPQGSYNVETKNDLGTIDNRLDTSPGARNTITATVSLGDIVLRTTK